MLFKGKNRVSKRGYCHFFRHTIAILMLENGVDIRFIQAMLGHVKLYTTQIYTQVHIKKLKEIHTLTHPARAKRTKVVNFVGEQEVTEEAMFSTLAAENGD